MLSASHAHAWACGRYVQFCFCSHVFCCCFWEARIFSAIGDVSNPLGGGHSQTSGSSSSASSLSVSSCSFLLSSTVGSLHQLFLAWSSRALSRSLIKDYACADFVDKFLTSVPSGPHVSLIFLHSVLLLHFVVIGLHVIALAGLHVFGVTKSFFGFAAGSLTLSATCERAPGLSEFEGKCR